MRATSLSAHSLNSWCLIRQTKNLSCEDSVLCGFSAFAPGGYVKSYSGSLNIDECKEQRYDNHGGLLYMFSFSSFLPVKVCTFFVSAFVKFPVSDTSNSKF